MARRGLILLGDLYVNQLSDLDAAERCYQRILELDGRNVQGLHNLCVVMVERGNLGAAPASTRWSGDELSKEALASKERRKAKEERTFANKPPKPGPRGGAGGAAEGK